MSAKIQAYACTEDGMEECDDGEWCRWSDVEPALLAAAEEAKRLRYEASRVRVAAKVALKFLESDDANAKRDAITFLNAALSSAPVAEPKQSVQNFQWDGSAPRMEGKYVWLRSIDGSEHGWPQLTDHEAMRLVLFLHGAQAPAAKADGGAS